MYIGIYIIISFLHLILLETNSNSQSQFQPLFCQNIILNTLYLPKLSKLVSISAIPYT